MDEYAMVSRECRPPFAVKNDAVSADYAFVKFLLGDLSRQFVAGRLIVVPDLNGVTADDIVRALDTIYTALARLCVEGRE